MNAALYASTSAPTVRPMPARGSVPGCRTTTGQALKGRSIGGGGRFGMTPVWPAPSGLHFISRLLPGALPHRR